MRYAGWNFEKTLLVTEKANIGRDRELVDVRLSVESDRALNLRKDVRVVLKRDWNVLDREIPSQAYRVAEHGGTTTFRLAFNIDLAAGGSQRIGVFYDNPDARAPTCETDLDVQGSGLGYRVDTPFYTVETDSASGQLKTITGKIDDQGTATLRRLALPGGVQEGNTVVFAAEDEGGCRPVAVGAVDWRDPQILDETKGPIFFKQTRQGRLVPPGSDPSRPWPELQITYKFFAEQPWFLVCSRLMFPEETTVFGVYNDVLTLSREQLSHYTFRPVSPGLPETDVEEMGHILIDAAHTADLPDGLAFSGFLPYDLPWHAFININLHKQHAMAGIQLRSAVHTPSGPPVMYRPAVYLIRDGKSVRWFRAPIYVHARNRRENRIRVPTGTVFEELNALYFSGWDQSWGQRVDALGRRLNHPLDVSSHPVYLGKPAPPEEYEALPVGVRGDAYRRSGVR